MLGFAVICALAAGARAQSFPAEGMYVTISAGALNQFALELSLDASDTANSDTTFPPYSGSNDQATYTFSSFIFDVDLEQLTFSSPAAPSFTGTWNEFNFIFQWNYHMCAKSWPNPCEDGYIQVFTTNTVQLSAAMSLSLTGPTVQFTSSSTSLIFNDGDIDIFVQCTDSVCWIDPDDIANAVAQNFVPIFQTGLNQAINTAAAKKVNSIPTTVPFPALGLDLVWTGGFDFYPANAPNLILYVAGEFYGKNHQGPPFSPDFVPPAGVFTSPASELDILLTPYMIRSGIWGLAQNGRFNLVITPNEVPANSPVQLNTNSPAIKAAAPGLAAYPNMNITVTLSLYNTSEVDITTGGINVFSTGNATFSLINSTYAHAGFDCLVDLGFVAALSTSLSGNAVTVSAKLSGWQPTVDVINSAVGPVSATILTQLLTLVLGFAPQPKPEVFNGPKDFQLSNVGYTPQAGWADISSDVSYIPAIPGTVCTPGGQICPVQNTCCQWGSSWGCCTLPNAVCCSSGCCFNGCTCNGDGTCSC